jgi:DNA-binding transcriptional regulator YdaS (Cro superfamily)
MTLNDYLSNSPETAAAFAARVGLSPASMARVRKGAQNISLAQAQTIVDATGGKVTLKDLADSLQDPLSSQAA